jgi:hypothetical protein
VPLTLTETLTDNLCFAVLLLQHNNLQRTASMANSDLARLREQTIHSTADEEAVTVNT